MLFEDVFEVLDHGPKKFSRVTRIVAHSENYEMDLVLDINWELYKLKVGEKFNMVLVKTLKLDGSAEEKNWVESDEPSLADNYEYVMHGKVFRINKLKKDKEKLVVYVSYGGLLMSLKGAATNLLKFELDKHVYLCLKKVESLQS